MMTIVNGKSIFHFVPCNHVSAVSAPCLSAVLHDAIVSLSGHLSMVHGWRGYERSRRCSSLPCGGDTIALSPILQPAGGKREIIGMDVHGDGNLTCKDDMHFVMAPLQPIGRSCIDKALLLLLFMHHAPLPLGEILISCPCPCPLSLPPSFPVVNGATNVNRDAKRAFCYSASSRPEPANALATARVPTRIFHADVTPLQLRRGIYMVRPAKPHSVGPVMLLGKGCCC
ncbi:hypothetical protein B0O80DRAFT_213568 [Mortierella sp. GBAus27b]|nr:hypothetical protein B0O80DRAFT_213568 [Mortierella sp. GBAus27b]